MKLLNYRNFILEEQVNKYKTIVESKQGAYDSLKFSPERMRYIAATMAIKESIELGGTAGLISESSDIPLAGIGAVTNPSSVVTHPNAGGQFAANYVNGSGDMPQMRIALAMDTIVETPGLELVPTVPIEFPQQRLAHMDIVYSGGDLNDTNFADLSYISFAGGNVQNGLGVAEYAKLTVGDSYVVTQTGYTTNERAILGRYIGSSRYDGRPIFVFDAVGTITQATNTFAESAVANETVVSLLATFGGTVSIFPINATTLIVTTTVGLTVALGNVTAKTVSAVRDHITGFNSRDFVSSSMDRAEGEKSNATKPLALKMWSTDIEVGTIEVPIEVTRTQIQDYGRYGIDAVGELYKAGRSQLSRTINREICEQFFRLGVTAAVKAKKVHGVDLNLFVAPAATASKDLSLFGLSEFKDITGTDQTSLFTAIPNAETNSSAENLETRQRRVVSRLRTVADFMGYQSNHGAANVGVVNITVASLLRDAKSYLTIKDDNTFTYDDANLYYLGHLDGRLALYVDPLMKPNDTRIALGINKGEDKPGLKFLPYDLVSSVEGIDTKNGNTKAIITSRYALAKTGFFPEASYFTFAINNGFGSWS